MDYLFDPDVIHECALAGLGKPKPAMFDAVADALESRHPGRIDRAQPWVYSIAGGAMIQMKLYYASLFEYLMIWGTPIGSEGHSGRHAVEFWDTVIDGETWYFAEGQFEKRVHRPGDRIFVGRNQARGMYFTNGVWAVEYARGPRPLSLPFGLADELLSTLDFATAAQTIGIYMSLIGHAWQQPLAGGARQPWLKQAGGALMRSVGSAVTRLTRPADASDAIPPGRTGTSRASPPTPGPRLSVAGGTAVSPARSDGSAVRG